ncbi:hypothetical protein SLS53_000008 [Cytospora paraplurivora]|uniref:Uncharacterized protein n=1 Tax=Cytospora paraplurivora TaxID=2898453 RepID=A0AAN9YM73_9PEZI
MSNPKEVLSAGAIVGVVVGAAVLLLIAMLLFYLYWRRQQSYDTEDMIVSDPSDFYGKGHGRGSYMTSLTSGNTSKPVPIYTTDHKPPPPSYAPPRSRAHEMDYMNNAEYYDRIEGSRGHTPMAMTNQLYDMATNSANHVDTSALPAHPAYIPRGHGRLGSRASRNSTPSISSLPRYNKPDSYTAQIYMNSLDDAGEPAQPAPAPAPALEDPRATGVSRATSPRNIQIELAGLPEESAPRASMPNPTAARQGGRATPIPFHALDGRDTPAPAPVPSRTSSSSNGGVARGPSRGPSLILSSVPRIKLPGRKPPRLTITGASPVEDISGPLAFPDSRFTQANDRIVEQMVDRGDAGEMPIGSGKSYLYG